MRYRADLTAGVNKLRESRVIADLLLRETDAARWRESIVEESVLQARSMTLASRLTTLIRGRLETMGPDLWVLVRDGPATVATHAVLAAAIKHSALLGDFLDLVVREQLRLFNPKLNYAVWGDYLDDCRGRDADMPLWNESTRRPLRSSVFQTLAQAEYLADTKSLTLQPVQVARQVSHRGSTEPTRKESMELQHGDVTEQIIGAAFEVNRVLGYGFLERVYQRAMQVEIQQRGLLAVIEVPIQVRYKDVTVGEYRADILVEEVVIVKIKVAKAYCPDDAPQLLNELKASGIKVGLLINFGRTKVEFKRMVF